MKCRLSLLILWLALKKRKLNVHPISSKIERSAEDKDSIELEAQSTRKNKKLNVPERIRKLEANQFYLMQKWLIELESIDEEVVRRVRKEMRARSARTYFDLSLAERDRLLEMAKEDAKIEMQSRRGSTNSNRIFGNLGPFHPHHNRKAHSHANLLRVAEPMYLPLTSNHFHDSPLTIKTLSLDRIEEKASP
ncbi:hypothetical protein M3Y97_00661500 [Aphelenchoides bicaudatus]|nr:hypothetical protein M3Y97_00661500 [Aphelenchoides bicaudatus]